MYSGEEIIKSLVEENFIVNTFEKKKFEFRERTEKTQSTSFSDIFDGRINQYIQRITLFQNITNDIYKFVSKNNANLLDANDFIFNEFKAFYSNLILIINSIDVQTESPANVAQGWFNKLDELLNEYKWQRSQDIKVSYMEKITNQLLYAIKTDYLIELNWWKSEELKEAEKISRNLIEHNQKIESALQGIDTFSNFQVNKIDEALKNVSTMFYYGDLYSVFKSNNKLWTRLFQAFSLVIHDIWNSPKWWLLGWLSWLFIVLWWLLFDFSFIFLSKDNWESIKIFEANWHILVSIHIIGASFIWYITVFCFNAYKKIEIRQEAYRFRSILTKSFWYLLETADEEQKKILYPKALDAIFKDLPESSSSWQDLNINLPITEIMKSIKG